MSSNRRAAQRKGILACTGAAILLTALVGFWLMYRLQTESVVAIQHGISSWQPALTAVRWTGIALVALYWNLLINKLAKAGMGGPLLEDNLTVLRWRTVGWLILLEVLLGQGLLNRAIRLVGGSVS